MRSRLLAQSRSIRLACSSSAAMSSQRLAVVTVSPYRRHPTDRPPAGHRHLEGERQVDGVLGSLASALVVTLAAPALLEPKPLVEQERRRIVHGYFEIQPMRVGLLRSAGQSLDQLPADAQTLPFLADGKRQDLR